jgi:hypothetical protein
MKKLLLILLLCMPILASAASTCDGMWTQHSKWQLDGAHNAGRCSCASCHIGSFMAGSAGGGITCTSCHGGGRPAARMKSTDHIPTQLDCIQCHTTTSFNNAKMNHTGIINGCATCHNGRNATGKPATHPTTTENCEICHNPTGWKCVSG